ncbi:MAG: hypothetical protein NTY03_02860 [Candidatus Bathyarchaeota archaeon]|nr:hypothetical protein [Candidatus Bathyarchaeota archaeon]
MAQAVPVDELARPLRCNTGLPSKWAVCDRRFGCSWLAAAAAWLVGWLAGWLVDLFGLVASRGCLWGGRVGSILLVTIGAGLTA